MTDDTLGMVWNPLRADEETLSAALASAGHDTPVRWYPTSESDGGQAAATSALDDDCTLVVAAGGDGTIRAVAEALAGKQVPMGIVPLGTGNLLARNLGLPLNDLEAAFRIAVSPSTRPVDVGWVELADGEAPGRHAFVVMAGFGIDSRMIAETDEDLKSKAGWLAYVAALGKAISSARVTGFTLAVDDATPERQSAHTLLIGNCGTLQGGVVLLPDALLDDGLLDILLLSADSLPKWLDTLKTMVWDNGVMRLLRGNTTRSGDNATHLNGSRLHVRVERPVTFQVDGDALGDITEVTVELDPGALLVRAP